MIDNVKIDLWQAIRQLMLAVMVVGSLMALGYAITLGIIKINKPVYKPANAIYLQDSGELSIWLDGREVLVKTGTLTMESKGWRITAERK